MRESEGMHKNTKGLWVLPYGGSQKSQGALWSQEESRQRMFVEREAQWGNIPERTNTSQYVQSPFLLFLPEERDLKLIKCMLY